jgi:zinc/manganese transport system substrate-binding protein
MLALVATIGIFPTAQADINVFACEPEWGALTTALGGEHVDVFTATTAQQDPHIVQARPSLIAKIRQADLVVCTGAELEVGWLPILLARGANAKIQPGAAGYFEAARQVKMLGVPQQLDRSQGDVHPQGNPHIQTDPRNILLVAKALGARLAQIDPAHQANYNARTADFVARWQNAITRWEKQAAQLKGVPIVVHHDGWPYLIAWLGLNNVASLEPKPGIPPSTADLSALLQRLREQPAKMVIRAAYQDDQADQWLAQHAHISVVTLPFTVGGTPAATDLFSLFDATIALLLKGNKS